MRLAVSSLEQHLYQGQKHLANYFVSSENLSAAIYFQLDL